MPPELMVSPAELRSTLGRFCTGVTVVSTERDGEVHLFVPGQFDRALAERIEGLIWEQLHFASHLRTERLGEFTVGTDLLRSESLALIQLLILYHLFTATASVALGGSGTRAEPEPVAT